MSKQIGLIINNKRFDLSVEEGFADFLSHKLGIDFNVDGNNDIKTVLKAYVRQTYELYKQEKKMQEIVAKIESQQ
jgi:hypothetical protein